MHLGCKSYRLVVLVGLALTVGQNAVGKDFYKDKPYELYKKAPAGEVLALPKYCWAKYNPQLEGAQYRIDRKSCGVYTNHFCEGLLKLNRAKNLLASKPERRTYLNGAAQDIEYTHDNVMKHNPGCYIKKHIVLAKKYLDQVSMELNSTAGR